MVFSKHDDRFKALNSRIRSHVERTNGSHGQRLFQRYLPVPTLLHLLNSNSPPLQVTMKVISLTLLHPPLPNFHAFLISPFALSSKSGRNN
jgi:hypothetical protein